MASPTQQKPGRRSLLTSYTYVHICNYIYTHGSKWVNLRTEVANAATATAKDKTESKKSNGIVQDLKMK